MTSIKVWRTNEDKILSKLCRMITERRLYKVVLSTANPEELYEQKKKELKEKYNIPEEEIGYYLSTGFTSNNTYNINDEKIQIAMKDGAIRDISEIDNPVVNQALAKPVHKNYICYIS